MGVINFMPSDRGLLLAGLRACTAMSLQTYIEDRGWQLGPIHIDLRDGEGSGGSVHIEREVHFGVSLTDDQHRLMAQLVEGTPITRVVKTGSFVTTRLICQFEGSETGDSPSYQASSKPSSRPSLRQNRTVALACRLLHRTLDEEFGLGELAAEMSVTKSYLVRLFRRELRTTPRQYRMLLQLSAACRLLARGMPGSDVAHSTGFCDQSHMTRWFKKVLGVTPALYAHACADLPLSLSEPS